MNGITNFLKQEIYVFFISLIIIYVAVPVKVHFEVKYN